MRIAYVCADPGVPVFGSKGCSIHVQEIVRAMLNSGADVDLFVARTGGDPPTDLEACVVQEFSIPKCEDVGSREVEQVLCSQRIGQALHHRGNYDLVFERHSLWSADAMSWAKDQGIPSVLEINAPLIDEQARHRQFVQSHLAGVLTRQALRDAGTVYGVSKAIVPYCQRLLANNRKVHVIPNGVNTDRFSPDVAPADSFSGLTIGFVGSLKPWHGVEFLLEAFCQFCQRSELESVHGNKPADCRLLIVGDGPERDAINANLNGRIGLREKVKLIGAIRANQVPAWLNSMDIAVAPYPNLDDFYFSPLKVFEYMSAGRAVLASASGQIRDIIQHGVSGWLCPPSDVDQLAAALKHLADNDSLRSELGKEARKQALGHSWSNVLGQILKVSAESSANPINEQGLRNEIEV